MKGAPKLDAELAQIVDAVVIHSPASFTFAGRSSSGIAMPAAGLNLAPDMPPLMNELIVQLYHQCFSNRFDTHAGPFVPPAAGSDPKWVESLAQANQSRERWEDEWRVVLSMPNGQIVAQRGKTSRTLAPGEFVNLSGSGMALAPGTAVRI